MELHLEEQKVSRDPPLPLRMHYGVLINYPTVKKKKKKKKEKFLRHLGRVVAQRKLGTQGPDPSSLYICTTCHYHDRSPAERRKKGGGGGIERHIK
jgi:hypothetical protein